MQNKHVIKPYNHTTVIIYETMEKISILVSALKVCRYTKSSIEAKQLKYDLRKVMIQ